jgi:uncharacterized protein (DUF4415 family)
MKSDVIERLFPKTDEEWEALIAAAPGEDRPLDPDAERTFLEKAVVVREGGPVAVRAALTERRRMRGPQKAPTKEQVAIRLSPEVLAYFRATGQGWQTRMDAALKEWIAQHAG